MTASVSLQNHKGFGWRSSSGVTAKGFIYDAGGDYVSELNLCRYFAQALDYAHFMRLVQDCNGSFAVVVERSDAIWAATDRTRSFPLFYTIDDANGINLADLAPVLKARLGAIAPEQKAIDEFLVTAYVTGADTLYPQIKQLPAGQCLCYDKSNKTLQIDSYYQYRHTAPNCTIEADLIEQLDSVHQRVFERLIKSLDGRTAVLPLSGGLDSRLVAVMLKRLNYSKVICFSYGSRGNSDSTVSSAVAEYLGYPWIFVVHTRQKWYDAYQSEQRREFYPYAANLCSMPHIQDWEAVRELQSQGLIPDDAVFIPGHTGDFLEGFHLPQAWAQQDMVTGRQLVSAIADRHYNHWPWQQTAPHYAASYRQSIERAVEVFPAMTTAEAVSSYEQWDWQERQAKFIVNSVRVYEYFGYEWRLPLWDAELLDFWAAVPTELRFGRCLYLNYVKAKQDLGITPAKHLAAIHVRAVQKALRMVAGNVLDIRYGRFGNSKSPLGYITQSIGEYMTEDLHYPDFIRRSQRVLSADLIGVQTLICLQEIL